MTLRISTNDRPYHVLSEAWKRRAFLAPVASKIEPGVPWHDLLTTVFPGLPDVHAERPFLEEHLSEPPTVEHTCCSTTVDPAPVGPADIEALLDWIADMNRAAAAGAEHLLSGYTIHSSINPRMLIELALNAPANRRDHRERRLSDTVLYKQPIVGPHGDQFAVARWALHPTRRLALFVEVAADTLLFGLQVSALGCYIAILPIPGQLTGLDRRLAGL